MPQCPFLYINQALLLNSFFNISIYISCCPWSEVCMILAFSISIHLLISLFPVTGCPKSSFLYFISLYFSKIGLDKQIIWRKVVSFKLWFAIFILMVPYFDSNIRFVYLRAKGARSPVYFPATYFLHFIARIARTPSLFFVNIRKDKLS